MCRSMSWFFLFGIFPEVFLPTWVFPLGFFSLEVAGNNFLNISFLFFIAPALIAMCVLLWLHKEQAIGSVLGGMA